ncbi:MAG: MFS transporter [Lachnospiraceae bacterium]
MAQSTSEQTKAASANFGAKGWLIIAISFFSIMYQSSIINDSLNVTIPTFAANGFNIQVLYMFSTISAWIAVIGAIIWGAVSNVFNARIAWAASLLLTAVASFFWGSASNNIVYFIAISAAAVGGMGFCYIANLNVISNWFPRKKGMAMGFVTCGFPVSASISTPLVSGMIASGGIKQVYTFYAIAGLVLFVVVAIFVRDYPEEVGCYPDNNRHFDMSTVKKELEEGLAYMKTSLWQPKKLFGEKKVWLIAFSLGIMELLSLGIMTNFMPRMLQSGYQTPEIIGMLAFTGLSAIIGSIGCGVLDAKVGPKKAIIITLIIAVCAIILNLIPTRPTLYLSLPFFGIMLGGAANYLVSITNTIWGRYDFPMAFKVLKPLVAAIGALGVSVVGVLGSTISYAVAYGVLAVLAILALIVILFVDDSLIGRN